MDALSQLVQALAPAPQQPTPLLRAAGQPRRRRGYRFGAHRDLIETGAFGPPPVGGAAAAAASSSSAASPAFGLPLLLSGNN